MAITPQPTALHPLHVDAGAKLTPFADYEMPLHYRAGIIKEHLHTRTHAGLFDVSHMGQILIKGKNAAQQLESLIPVDLVNLPVGRQKYGMFTNPSGGVLDDLMIICRKPDEYMLVVNAACKHADLQHLEQCLGNQPEPPEIQLLERSLLALQGPHAARVLADIGCDTAAMKFMDARELQLCGAPCILTRSGYSGEDGFEISVPDNAVTALAEVLLQHAEVMWIGLGARDSLRLEAGLSLYGHELTTETTPIEANLLWAISKARRNGGERAGGFPGAEVILAQIPRKVARILVALLPQGRAPVRAGTVIENGDGNTIGQVTSGGFSPTLGKPVCLAYVDIEYSAVDTELNAVVRDRRLAVVVTKPPFVVHNYQTHKKI